MIVEHDWGATVDAFRHAGDHAERMLRNPVLADRWSEPSALAEFTVGGIAGHLLGVLRAFEHRCDLAVPDATVSVSPADGYAAVRLPDPDSLDEAPFRIPRDSGERLALRGRAALCDEFGERLRRVEQRLRTEQPDRRVVLPDDTKSTTLHDYTVTRIVELVVHGDDLAAAVGDPAEPPADAACIAIEFLVTAVRRRVGDAATLRALAGRAGSDVLRAL